MNERIQKLVEQATTKISFRLDPNNYKHIDDPEGEFERVEFDKEKFAELIVRECVDIALRTKAEQLELASDTKAFDSMPEGAKDHSFGRVVAVNQVVANIKEHFGVEE